MYTQYRMIFGDFGDFMDLNDNFTAGGVPLLKKLLYVFYTFVGNLNTLHIFTNLVNIVLLNLLIALMGGSYSKVQEHSDLEGRMELLNVLLEIEKHHLWMRRIPFFGWRKSSHELSPRWIHVLAPTYSSWDKQSTSNNPIQDKREEAMKQYISSEIREAKEQVLHLHKEMQDVKHESDELRILLHNLLLSQFFSTLASTNGGITELQFISFQEILDKKLRSDNLQTKLEALKILGSICVYFAKLSEQAQEYVVETLIKCLKYKQPAIRSATEEILQALVQSIADSERKRAANKALEEDRDVVEYPQAEPYGRITAWPTLVRSLTKLKLSKLANK